MKMGALCTMMVVMVLLGSVWGAPNGSLQAPNPSANASTCSEPLWCVAKPTSTDVALNDNIDYICHNTGVDCSPIYKGGACFDPQSPYNHASFVMNRYYQSHGQHTWECNFSGTGMFASSDPSQGSCFYDHA